MNYIVFDLEWNQCPIGKEFQNPNLPFEIIEIGAIKLDENLEIVDEFHGMVKPVVYKELNYHTQSVIQTDIEEFKDGDFFDEVAKSFFEWCKEEYILCTWGSIDLVELQRNLKYYYMLDLLKGPLLYYDIQKLFSIQYEDGKSRKALRYAVEFLDIKITKEFHRALGDAFYTAKVFQKILIGLARKNYSVDTYQNPKGKSDELYLIFDNYSKFISHEFNTKEEAMLDRNITSTKCFHCRKNVKKKVRWFCVNGKTYYCIAYCPNHGYLKGKIRIKKTDEGKYYVIKTMKYVTEDVALEIKKKQDHIRQKRQQKRLSKT